MSSFFSLFCPDKQNQIFNFPPSLVSKGYLCGGIPVRVGKSLSWRFRGLEFFREILFVASHQFFHYPFSDRQRGITFFASLLIIHQNPPCPAILRWHRKTCKTAKPIPWPMGRGEQSLRSLSFMLAMGVWMDSPT